MPTAAVYDMTNTKVGDIELSADIFGGEINEGLVHQAVVMQMASWRLGTHSRKLARMFAAADANRGGKRAQVAPVQVPAEVRFGAAAERFSDRTPATTHSQCPASNVASRSNACSPTSSTKAI